MRVMTRHLPQHAVTLTAFVVLNALFLRGAFRIWQRDHAPAGSLRRGDPGDEARRRDAAPASREERTERPGADVDEEVARDGERLIDVRVVIGDHRGAGGVGAGSGAQLSGTG